MKKGKENPATGHGAGCVCGACARAASVADSVRERGDGYLESVEALEESHARLIAAGEAVEAAWESGDLAGATRELAQAVAAAKRI